MKKIFALSAFASLASTPSFAAQLSCWNVYAKSGTAPFVTATIESDQKLSHIQIHQAKEDSGDTTNAAGVDLKDVAGQAEGKEITSGHSPYKGNQEFTLADGVRLVLPLDLSADGLKQARLKGGNLPEDLADRQNAFLGVAGHRVMEDQGGESFYRMHCVSK